MNPRELEKFGHAGYLLLLGGMVWLAQGAEPEVVGWILRMVGELIWVYVGIRLGMKSIWAWGAAFIVIDIYGVITRLVA